MAGVALQLTGSLTVKPVTGCAPDGATSPGGAYRFGLRASNRSATLEGGSAQATVASPASFVVQPWTNGLKAGVFYLRVLTDAALLLRVTLETTGAVIIPVQGSLGPWELPSSDRATQLEIQGTGTFEWSATGAQG